MELERGPLKELKSVTSDQGRQYISDLFDSLTTFGDDWDEYIDLTIFARNSSVISSIQLIHCRYPFSCTLFTRCALTT
uniref:Integrase catalytic domain-containing protein n=1 Tax=Steinernema glaseri TaxID=37863 RepID=A0A1I7ZJS5_9BILA